MDQVVAKIQKEDMENLAHVEADVPQEDIENSEEIELELDSECEYVVNSEGEYEYDYLSEPATSDDAQPILDPSRFDRYNNNLQKITEEEDNLSVMSIEKKRHTVDKKLKDKKRKSNHKISEAESY